VSTQSSLSYVFRKEGKGKQKGKREEPRDAGRNASQMAKGPAWYEFGLCTLVHTIMCQMLRFKRKNCYYM